MSIQSSLLGAAGAVASVATEAKSIQEHKEKEAETKARQEKYDAQRDAEHKAYLEKTNAQTEAIKNKDKIARQKIDERAYRTAMGQVNTKFNASVRHVENQYKNKEINEDTYKKTMKNIISQYDLDAAELESRYMNKGE